jgi:DNA-binding NtrC family response regulator
MNYQIMVVDDEKNIRMGLARSLKMDGYDTVEAEDGQDAWDALKKHPVDCILTDLKMPRMSGEVLLEKVTGAYPGIPVIVLTGHGTIETAVGAMRSGAYDFLTKPVNLDRLSLLVKRALGTRKLAIEHRHLQEELEALKKSQVQKLIGKSPVMQQIQELIKQVAPSKASVLITGESGVGKELVAEALHQLSDRRDGPMVKTHCAALSESLLESELFGHEKGAFTGAVSTKKGRFELAGGGSIFLDEIGEINQSLQVKLLRVLQERTFERVGGEKSIRVDTRIISATNRNLKGEVEAGNFREDLYYRLNIVHIHVPPLRERREDIPLLTAHFLKELARDNGREIEGIEPKAQALLTSYDWPGNIRELRNTLESAIVLSKNKIIEVGDLPTSLQDQDSVNAVKIPLGSTLSDAERMLIQSTLGYCRGNKTLTAKTLGIGRKTLHRKLDEYQLEASEEEE